MLSSVKNVLFASLLFGSALGIPTDMTKRDDPWKSLDLDTPICMLDSSLPDIKWAITIPNDDKLDSGGCGAGFLDNIRGRCGVVTTWHCAYGGAKGTTAVLDFWTSHFCTAWDMTQAINAASYGTIPAIVCSDIFEGGPDISNHLNMAPMPGK